MRMLVLTAASICFAISSHAQVATERIKITGGSQAMANFMMYMYSYPDFREGVISYRNGQTFKRRINYNRMLETVQFIDEKGDTLAIANETAVKDIRSDSNVYVYVPECVEIVNSNSQVQLVKHEKLRLTDLKRKGAYGIPNSSSSMDAINQVYIWTNQQLDVNEILQLSKTTAFYIRVGEKEKVPASKKNVLEMFPKQSDKIRDFIESKKISFTKEADLKELVQFLGSVES